MFQQMYYIQLLLKGTCVGVVPSRVYYIELRLTLNPNLKFNF